MTEIKFLKDLPIKLTNTNKSVLVVLGGDIYYDSDGNRYGFISFRNPIFSPCLFVCIPPGELARLLGMGQFHAGVGLLADYSTAPSIF